jgi:hypothetical protein
MRGVVPYSEGSIGKSSEAPTEFTTDAKLAKLGYLQLSELSLALARRNNSAVPVNDNLSQLEILRGCL